MTLAHTAGRAPRHRAPARKARGPLVGPMVLLLTVTALAALYVAYVLWPRWPGPAVLPNAPSLPIIVGGVLFNLPPASIRVPLQRRPGAQDRIDLAFDWPSLAAPDLAAKPRPLAGQDPAAIPPPQRLFVTIATADTALSPDERLESIYPRYIDSDPQAGPNGLLRLPFRDGSPYEGEDLIYDAGKADRFLVRCSRNDRTRGSCLYERRIDGADVTVRFPRDWLDDWRTVAGKIDQLIARLRK